MEDFYNIIPLECLPKEYGGPLDSVENYASKQTVMNYFLPT